ncbi:MAG: NDP-sugar synthase [Candidatus Bathyarchaeota archaeon]|nr:MAG: NDP-sugar synthase [Candidatus Bathyarchaeota archaeon]
MQAVILAGGLGSRLRPLTYVIPKTMLPIGGKPLLEHTIRYLNGYGISEFIVCVAYLKNHIMNFLKDGKQLDVKIQYAEAEMPLGTGGQLKTASKYISERFLLLNGDIVTSLNIKQLIKFHEKHQGIGTIALKKYEIPVPYGHVELDEDNHTIGKFEEKPTFSFKANAGVYILEPRILDYIPSNRVVSMERETFQELLKKGEQLNGYFEDAYWADVGTLTDFERVDKELLEGFYSNPTNPSSNKQRNITHRRE